VEHIVIRKITPMQYILNRMQIRIANEQDQAQLLKYDRHIQPDRLFQCIRDGLAYALWDGNQIVGILRYSLFWQTIPFLDLVFIDENYRGQGWGSRMMAHWEESMQQAGYCHVMLSTQEDESAKFFYEKIGYHRIGAFLPPDQEADEIMYLKELKP
jgi:ribosomal protein S18 acetylase RimI-like enzyme